MSGFTLYSLKSFTLVFFTKIYIHKPQQSHPHPLYMRVCERKFPITRSVNKVMRLIQYNSVLTFKLQIEFVPFKIVPLGGYTPPETLFPLSVATLVVANRNRF